MAEEFSISARLYAEIVAGLSITGIPKDDCVRLLATVGEAQKRSEAAFIAFEEHLDSHQCWDNSPTVKKKSATN